MDPAATGHNPSLSSSSRQMIVCRRAVYIALTACTRNRRYCQSFLCDRQQPPRHELLSLQVSSPALLLNHMAERYASTSRILMEFVDNSLDDAEALYDPTTASYSRDIIIDVCVSRKDRFLRILDNSRGMLPSTLSRVVMRVGESRKRGASFVNGQFGFGMQSFRAACSTLTVASKAEGAEGAEGAAGTAVCRIRVEREQSDGFQLEELGNGDVPELSDRPSGTQVTLSGFDRQAAPPARGSAWRLRVLIETGRSRAHRCAAFGAN